MRVLLLGSNSGRNAGDAALLETVIREISQRRPGTVFEVPTTNPDFIRQSFPGLPVVPLSIMPWNLSLRLLGLPVLRALWRCDLALILDGIIFDHRLFNPAFNFLITLVPLAPLARTLKCRMVCFEVGIGPLRTRAGRLFTRIVCQSCADIMVREEDSKRLLSEAGVTRPEVQVFADAAFISQPAGEGRVEAMLAELDLDGRPLVGLNLSRYGGEWMGKGGDIDRRAFQERMARLVDRFAGETGATVVLTGTQHMDRAYLAEVRGMVRDPERVRLVSNREYSPAELTGLMGRMEIFIGMRLHSLILASSMRTPVLGLTYAPKVRSLFDLLGRPDLALDLRDLDVEVLLERALDLWRAREKEKARLVPVIESLKERAAAGFERLVERRFPR